LGNKCYEIGDVRVLELSAEGEPPRNDRDAVAWIGEAFEQRARFMVIPAERLDDDFFDLKTRIAGDVLQKFVNYQIRVAIVGDISRHIAESDALRDFVIECNRGEQVCFVSSMEELRARLGNKGSVS
jgi:hypothetical protein